jgi:hypothetical protein
MTLFFSYSIAGDLFADEGFSPPLAASSAGAARSPRSTRSDFTSSSYQYGAPGGG